MLIARGSIWLRIWPQDKHGLEIACGVNFRCTIAALGQDRHWQRLSLKGWSGIRPGGTRLYGCGPMDISTESHSPHWWTIFRHTVHSW